MRRNAIKEGFDNLPIAACFFDTNGVARMVNRHMLYVGDMLLGSSIQTLEELRHALANPPEIVLQPNKAFPIYYFPDGKALRFEEKVIVTKNGNRYTQVTAADVTELMEQYSELEKENALLADANKRAHRLYEQMSDIVREEETLAMKMRVHDDIGHSILSARRILLTDRGIDEIRKNAAVWEKAIRVLCNANSPSRAEDPIEYASRRARDIGVELVIDGALPDDENIRSLFSLAICECVTNCVRHADGTRVFVNAITFGNVYIITITNNGALPTKTVAEGGGLSSLRRKVERSGGSMTVQSFPCFALKVMLTKKEDDR